MLCFFAIEILLADFYFVYNYRELKNLIFGKKQYQKPKWLGEKLRT